MKENFKVFGEKAWAITNDSFIYGKTKILYSDMNCFKIVDRPTTVRANGSAISESNGRVFTCVFKYSDMERAQQAIAFASKKIAEAHGIIKDYKYKLIAHTGTELEVYKNYILIYPVQPEASVSDILSEDKPICKRIDYSDIVSIQFNEPSGASAGCLHFAISADSEGKDGYSIPVTSNMVSKTREILSYIEDRQASITNKVVRLSK